jgi:hypothetical protein
MNKKSLVLSNLNLNTLSIVFRYNSNARDLAAMLFASEVAFLVSINLLFRFDFIVLTKKVKLGGEISDRAFDYSEMQRCTF